MPSSWTKYDAYLDLDPPLRINRIQRIKNYTFSSIVLEFALCRVPPSAVYRPLIKSVLTFSGNRSSTLQVPIFKPFYFQNPFRHSKLSHFVFQELS